MSITYRSEKGSNLEPEEVDENFRYLDEKGISVSNNQTFPKIQGLNFNVNDFIVALAQSPTQANIKLKDIVIEVSELPTDDILTTKIYVLPDGSWNCYNGTTWVTNESSSNNNSTDYEFYGIIRYVPESNSWELFNDSGHESYNISSVSSSPTGNGFFVNPIYPSSALYKIGVATASPDETLVRCGISGGPSFGHTQMFFPVIQNQGFGFTMNGTSILADTVSMLPSVTDVSWDASNLSLTLHFSSRTLAIGQGIGVSEYNFNIVPGSNSNFWFTKYDINYFPNGVKVKIKFYNLAGAAITPTGRWIFNRTQPWSPLNNQLSKLGPNANFWVHGRYKKI
jgi:hypothetical protein